MCVLMKKGFWKFCCIVICISFSLPNISHHQRIADETEKIFFHKCCEEDQVYEFENDKCIDRSTHQFKTKEQKFPINYVHKDFSA